MTRYLFSVNPGRAGSHYLSELFRHADGCVSEHEPLPKLNGAPMRSFLAGDPRPLERLIPEKVAAIEKARGDRVYVETNHCFIKGFGWLLPRYLPESEIGVIVLRRDPNKVSASLSRLLCTPFLRLGDQWLITPQAQPHYTPLPAGFSLPRVRFYLYRAISRTVGRPGIIRRATRGRMQVLPPIKKYELALLNWYVAETYARWDAYQRRFPAVRSVDVNLEDLNAFDHVSGLFASFGLTPRPSIHQVIGHPTNLKAAQAN